MNIVASFTQTLNQYSLTVTSNNTNYGNISDGSTTEQTQVISDIDYGSQIVVNGKTIEVKDSEGLVVLHTLTAVPHDNDNHYTYDLASWSSESTTLTGNKTITGTFTQELTKHTVAGSIVTDDGSAKDGFAVVLTDTFGSKTLGNATTDTDGKFSFSGISYNENGCKITITKTHYDTVTYNLSDGITVDITIDEQFIFNKHMLRDRSEILEARNAKKRSRHS